MKHISAHLLEEKHLLHNALRDAQDQAEIFREILKRARKTKQVRLYFRPVLILDDLRPPVLGKHMEGNHG